jgi:exosortase/archaeosortase family protein
VAWSLAFFGLIRLAWFEAHAIVPLTQMEAGIAQRGFGLPAAPIEITLACSGADALALCVGAILAYPVRWPMRLAGAAGGIGIILALNIVRIGTLGRAAASPSWFEVLHVYAWPALLTLAIAGYVFSWMRFADRRPAIVDRARPRRAARARPLSGRFVLLTVAFIAIFTAASPLYLESAGVLAIAGFVARSAALALGLFGIQASATANVLLTAKGGFMVTQECISTPLIPVSCAAIFAYLDGWRARSLALLAVAPLFVALGIARLLVVALPAAIVGSPLFLIHAFYQLLLAAVVVCLAAFWRHGASAMSWRRACLGVALGGVFAYLLAPLDARALATAFAGGAPLEDSQGAIALLPAFQVGLYVALAVAAFAVITWRPFVTGLAVLAVSQVAVLAALHLAVRHAGFMPHVRDVRAWALAAPLLVIAAMVAHERPAR